MKVDPSKVASWGSPEDRPERDQMRGLSIGRGFMAKFREAKVGKKQHEYSWWLDWVPKNTALELRWMWNRNLQYMEKNADVYAQVAGELILEETAKGNVPSAWWFRTDICETYGWLFEPACLKHDGWRIRDLTFTHGRTEKSWTRSNG